MLVLSGIAFMASVATELQDASVAVVGVITLIIIVDVFRGLGKK